MKTSRSTGQSAAIGAGSALWIAWEDHRRSRELADALGIPLFTLISHAPYAARAVVLSVRTAGLLLARRPRLVFVQNPSMVLAAVACALRHVFRYTIVVDRHSNFRLSEMNNPALSWRVFHALSRYTIRVADLTIVTNDALRQLVADWGGRGFVLPDRMPSLPSAVRQPQPGSFNVAVICSHGKDEPIKEVLDAARALPDVTFHITGNGLKTEREYGALIGPNVRFTGFLPEPEYEALLASCDAAMVLTTAEDTLLCGAYEAVALGTPLILSDQRALTDYFYKGRIATANTAAAMADAVRSARANVGRLRDEVRALRLELETAWQARWTSLQQVLACSRPRAAAYVR